ncbi:MAG: hypothetical protein DMG17_19110 [Acidobacteria bacterium]|nr:MAG: hypothetical protein DMG17_19110 [Acidobacteriota bacterium]
MITFGIGRSHQLRVRVAAAMHKKYIAGAHRAPLQWRIPVLSGIVLSTALAVPVERDDLRLCACAGFSVCILPPLRMGFCRFVKNAWWM